MAKVNLPPPARRAGAVSADIAAHVERLITFGELKPGDRLPSELALAADFQVSRASLREAMHELAAKNLIERRPGRGTTVLPPPEHVRDLYERISDEDRTLRDVAELRETIEPRIARLAAYRATRANLIELDAVLRDPAESLTAPESLRLDLEFHMLLARASQNPLMASLNTLTCAWLAPVRALSHATGRARQMSHRGHRTILDAVTERDGDAAATAMRLHLHEVAELTEENYSEVPA